MGQSFKFGLLAAASMLALASTPVWAGGQMGGAHFTPKPAFGVHPHSGMAFRPGLHGFHDRHFGRGPGFYGTFGRFGFDYGYAFPHGVHAPRYNGAGLAAGDYFFYSAPTAGAEFPDYPPYPVGYDGASYAPTGNGVIYDVPPPGCCAPKIIYISGGHVTRETYVRPRQNIIVRGAASVD